jgi:hypothetical protein
VWPKKVRCACAPLYEPDWWNVPQRQPFNNCYNYAPNYRSDTFAQPGLAAGAMYASRTCAAVLPAAVKDELINQPKANNKCPGEGHLVALVVAPGFDFHWYRKGRNGYWSHKPGSTAVTNLDNSGNLIRDPRTADRGPYTDFCTFMVVMHGHIKLFASGVDRRCVYFLRTPRSTVEGPTSGHRSFITDMGIAGTLAI